MNRRRCDCVVIGYNDWDFRSFIRALEPSREYSSAYMNVLKNTVVVDGVRLLYNELLGTLMTRAAGTPHRYNAFEVASLGGCYLTSYLRRRGFGVELVNFFSFDHQQLADVLEDKPRAAVITTTFYFMPQPVQEIIAFIRQRSPETTIILGGPYVYNICRDRGVQPPDGVLESIGADIYIFDSQGEQTLARVLSVLKQGDATALCRIPNLVLRINRDFTWTLREIENNDLDQESEDWAAFDAQLVTPVTYMRTARSCAFSCAFCSYPEMAGALALKSVETVEAELRALKAMGGRFIVFVDDTFNVPLPRFKQLLRMMIANDFGFRWVSFLRCSNVDEEALDLAVASGCHAVFLGIESGDQRVLDNMNKSAQLDRYAWGMRELRRRNIATSASFIIGFPGETRESVEHTIEFIDRNAPTFYTVEQYYYQSHTPIAKRAGEFELRGRGYTWHHRTMDWSESSELVGHVYRSVTGSRILPLYGLGVWGLPYFETRGLGLEQMKRFLELAQPMLIASMEEDAQSQPAQEARIVDWLRTNVVKDHTPALFDVASPS